jgi:hypothetical protein
MSGKEAVAVGILETQLKSARKEGKSHVAYEIEMLLVEMHIYQVLLHSFLLLANYIYIYIYILHKLISVVLIYLRISLGRIQEGFSLRMPES